MPFAIEMFLDPASAGTVRQIWSELAGIGVAPRMHQSGARPHVTLGASDRLDVDACSRFLADFAATNAAPAVRFSSIGIFAANPAVVFLAPVITSDLLALHRSFHHRFPDFADNPWVHYLPDQWVPHCTLAMECSPAVVPRAVKVCGTIHMPLDGHLDEVGVVEFRPVGHRSTFRFAGG